MYKRIVTNVKQQLHFELTCIYAFHFTHTFVTIKNVLHMTLKKHTAQSISSHGTGFASMHRSNSLLFPSP